MSELRWNVLLGEWVVTATHRQNRTFHPPENLCPLCPSDANGATEIPESEYDIVVFENKFPTFSRFASVPAVAPMPYSPVAPSHGVCEVVVYTDDHASTLANQPVGQIDKLVRVWTDRCRNLEALPTVKYVFVFENKGGDVGVTLEHPHGQIYAYPFIPPRIARELAQCLAHQAMHGQCMICSVLEDERRSEQRIVAENASFTAYVPFAAQWPYEVHICARRHLQALVDLERDEQRDLAAMLKTVLSAYDNMWDMSMPYVMVLHQRPSDGADYSHYHFHIEFYPPLRTPAKLKYLAGSEAGAGTFINDVLPEDAAGELRRHVKDVTWSCGAGNG